MNHLLLPAFLIRLFLATPALRESKSESEKGRSPIRRAEAVEGPRVAHAEPVIAQNDMARFLAGLPVVGLGVR